MVNESLRDKLRKVLALAQSGQAGERIQTTTIYAQTNSSEVKIAHDRYV